ncbi:hypothetical protein DMENIID0001_132270 [Sergentomyia squamirostris]
MHHRVISLRNREIVIPPDDFSIVPVLEEPVIVPDHIENWSVSSEMYRTPPPSPDRRTPDLMSDPQMGDARPQRESHIPPNQMNIEQRNGEDLPPSYTERDVPRNVTFANINTRAEPHCSRTQHPTHHSTPRDDRRRSVGFQLDPQVLRTTPEAVRYEPSYYHPEQPRDGFSTIYQQAARGDQPPADDPVRPVQGLAYPSTDVSTRPSGDIYESVHTQLDVDTARDELNYCQARENEGLKSFGKRVAECLRTALRAYGIEFGNEYAIPERIKESLMQKAVDVFCKSVPDMEIRLKIHVMKSDNFENVISYAETTLKRYGYVENKNGTYYKPNERRDNQYVNANNTFNRNQFMPNRFIRPNNLPTQNNFSNRNFSNPNFNNQSNNYPYRREVFPQNSQQNTPRNYPNQAEGINNNQTNTGYNPQGRNFSNQNNPSRFPLNNNNPNSTSINRNTAGNTRQEIQHESENAIGQECYADQGSFIEQTDFPEEYPLHELNAPSHSLN